MGFESLCVHMFVVTIKFIFDNEEDAEFTRDEAYSSGAVDAYVTEIEE